MARATLPPASIDVGLNLHSQLIDNNTGVEDELIIGLSTFDKFNEDEDNIETQTTGEDKDECTILYEHPKSGMGMPTPMNLIDSGSILKNLKDLEPLDLKPAEPEPYVPKYFWL